ncbi:MAG: prepilin-type N-terminal cleavage/methylation domain-containing protein [Verrucomicrobia bacterium]|nr:prepilin-type N-terminal cleavage/methylation domain-containing protein [Verrucomicrobiota bacterium]
MSRWKKRAFTLIELLVSLSLSAILIGFLMHIFFHATHAPSGRLWPLMEKYACRQRLNQVLPEILTPPQIIDGALLFTFNNGVDDDPHFCGEVGGRLSLDGEKRLILTLFPAASHWQGEFSPRLEILLSQISTLDFSFYEIPTRAQPGAWKGTWEQEDLPALVKIQCTAFATTYPILASGKPPRYYIS